MADERLAAGLHLLERNSARIDGGSAGTVRHRAAQAARVAVEHEHSAEQEAAGLDRDLARARKDLVGGLRPEHRLVRRAEGGVHAPQTRHFLLGALALGDVAADAAIAAEAPRLVEHRLARERQPDAAAVLRETLHLEIVERLVAL